MTSGFEVSRGVSRAETQGRSYAEVLESVQADPRRAMLGRVFNSQLSRLMGAGYPEAMGLSHSDFTRFFGQLHRMINPTLVDRKATGEMVIVIPSFLVPLRKQVELLRVGKRKGVTGITAERLRREPPFDPQVPYLAYGIAQRDFLPGYMPYQVGKYAEKHGRSLLTAEEAIAFALHFPDFFPLESKIEMPNERIDDGSGFLVFMGSSGGEARDQIRLAWQRCAANDRRDWRPWTVSARTFAASSQTND